jgi:lactobin A/cerein 7B family class IIb bacteriocin
MEAEMRDAENTADIRSLSDAELNAVSGGILPELIIIGGAAALLIGFSGPNVGTMEQQAAALGMSHLL